MSRCHCGSAAVLFTDPAGHHGGSRHAQSQGYGVDHGHKDARDADDGDRFRSQARDKIRVDDLEGRLQEHF